MSEADDQSNFFDTLERYDNLMEAATVRQSEQVGFELSPAEMDEFANLVGPMIAAVNAAGACAELLARWAGVPAAEIDATIETSAQADLGGSREGGEVGASPGAALGQLFVLHQAVVNDLAALGVRVASASAK